MPLSVDVFFLLHTKNYFCQSFFFKKYIEVLKCCYWTPSLTNASYVLCHWATFLLSSFSFETGITGLPSWPHTCKPPTSSRIAGTLIGPSRLDSTVPSLGSLPQLAEFRMVFSQGFQSSPKPLPEPPWSQTDSSACMHCLLMLISLRHPQGSSSTGQGGE